jgi:spoIIIJ-associated protein
VNKVTAQGRTVEEAVENGLLELNISREKAVVRVIDEGRKGFLRFFKSKPAIVEIERVIDPIEEATEFLKAVTTDMGVTAEIHGYRSGKRCSFSLKSDDIGVLIGKRGQTIHSLQLLTQLVINRYSTEYLTVTLDAEGYHDRRKQTLENLAKKLATQVSNTSQSVKLEPMPAHERKIIHQTLKKHPLVRTSSVEEGTKRRILIEPNK